MDTTATELTQHLEAVAAVVPKLQVAPVDLLPRWGVHGELPALNLFDVARGFSRRVPMVRLLEIEPDIRPYLAALIVRAV